MSKADLVEKIAQHGDMSKADAKRLIDLVFSEVMLGLKNVKRTGRYSIGTFGTFYVSKRKARKGRNPRTGELIDIKAMTVLKFRPSIYLKKAAGC